MICTICDMGLLEEHFDERGFRFNICNNCGCDVVTSKDSLYNKAKRTQLSDKQVNELLGD